MEPYSKFRPTGCDSAGLGLKDRQNWLVCPVSRNRDSGCLAESNFSVLLESVGGEGEDCEVHRFGHWGPGWFEIILVRPGSESARIAAECESALADYPVLSDEDYSEREYAAKCELWAVMSLSERIEACREAEVCIMAARRDDAPARVLDRMERLL